MTILHAIFFGILQGLGEMLPISSSAHLVLFPYLFSFPDPGLAFDVALHLGTLVAILTYFWRDWLNLAKSTLKIIKTQKIETFEEKLVGYLLIASIPGALFGYLLDKQAETIFRSPLLIALSLAIMGAILWFADSADRGKRNMNDLKISDSVKIGLSQALAIIPGVSRSGVTMTTGLFLGLNRTDVARVSFLMSGPIIFGAALVKVTDVNHDLISSFPFWVALVMAALSSLFAINFLLNYLKKHNFKIFAYYRFLLAAVVVIVYFLRS